MGRRRFRLGQWTVDPDSNAVYTDEARLQLEPRAMDVLLFLCQHAPAVVSADQVLDACWGGAPQGDNAVHKTIAQLRRALGDESAAPRYIETIRKRGYRIVAEVQAEEDVVPGSWLDESPFRGLEAFEERHAPIFCGRRLAVDALRQAVLRQVESDCAMALVLGASGAGKTSLVRAGLVPRLQAERGAGLVIDSVLQFDCADAAQTALLAALGSVLLDTEIDGKPVFLNESADSLGRQLEQDPVAIADRFHAAFGAIRLLLFIDRFEAIFRLPQVDEASRVAFVSALDALARSGAVLVVLACRNDFYPHLAAYPSLMTLKEHGAQFDLLPPNGAELRQIIRQPAGAARLRFEVDDPSGMALDDVLCDAAKTSADMLPLLQYCLQELYRQRGPDGELTHAVYQSIGGIDGAIGARAEQVIATLAPAQVAALPSVLSRLVSVAEDELAVTARPVPWQALRTENEREFVKALVEARLFVSDLHGGVPAFGIVHEALLRRWPRVAAWIAEHRDMLQMQTRVRAQAHRWEAAGRPRDLLLPAGVQARQGRSLLSHEGIALAVSERTYIETSLRRARIGERVRLAVVVMIAFLAVLAGFFGMMARTAQAKAEQHRTEAEGLLGYMLGDFVDKLRPLGRLDLLDGVSNRALGYLSDLRPDETNPAALTQRAKALHVISEVKIARGDPAGATVALQAAHTILQRQLRHAPNERPLLKVAGENAFWLGQIHYNQSEWDKANAYFGEYRTLADRYAQTDPADMDAVIEQSYAHSNLGSVALEQGDVKRAADEFARSVELKERALVAMPDRRSLQVDLADSLSWLASAQERLGRLDLALHLYERGLGLMQTLHAQQADNAKWTNRLASAYSHRGDVRLALGMLRDADIDFGEAESLLLAITRQDSSNRIWQRNLYRAQLRRIDAQGARLTRDQALTRLATIEERLTALSRAEPSKLLLQAMIAGTQRRRAAVLSHFGDRMAATRLMAPAVANLESIRTQAAADPVVRDELMEALLLMAELAFADQALDNAHRHCLVARQLLEPMAGGGDYRVLAPWVRIHQCLGNSTGAVAAQRRLDDMRYREHTFFK